MRVSTVCTRLVKYEYLLWVREFAVDTSITETRTESSPIVAIFIPFEVDESAVNFTYVFLEAI